MQRITLEELKHILFHAFRDHLTMKDIENIIINEEESLNENSGRCQTEFEGGEWNRCWPTLDFHYFQLVHLLSWCVLPGDYDHVVWSPKMHRLNMYKPDSKISKMLTKIIMVAEGVISFVLVLIRFRLFADTGYFYSIFMLKMRPFTTVVFINSCYTLESFVMCLRSFFPVA